MDAQDALTPLDGPTVIIDLAGMRFLVDPTFDQAQEYVVGPMTLTKTTAPSWDARDLGHVDAVLLSHDQHPDNLDDAGRALLADIPLTLTTPYSARRIGGTAQGMYDWTSQDVGPVQVTAVPAQHGPDGTQALTGPVTGFLLTAAGSPTVYVSGDNASLVIVRQVAERAPLPQVAVLAAGGARLPGIDGPLTLTSHAAVEAALILGRPMVMSTHTDGWAHCSESRTAFEDAFAEAGLSDLLLPVGAGRPVAIGLPAAEAVGGPRQPTTPCY